jgi:hypothetical protein
VVGAALDVVAEVEVGAEAEAMAQIHWPVVGGDLFQCMLCAEARVYASEVCLYPWVACFYL